MLRRRRPPLVAWRDQATGAMRDALGRWSAPWRRLRRRAVMARMLPGDVVLSSPRIARLSFTALLYRLLLRSQYVHAMLYLGDGRVLHTTARQGVTIDPLPGKLFDRARYRIRRVPGLERDQREQVVAGARALLDHDLDHLGLVTNIPARWFGLPHPLLQAERNRLWCSQLIQKAYADVGVSLVPPERSGTVTSEDLARTPVMIEV